RSSTQVEFCPPAFFASAAAKAIMWRCCLRRFYLDRLSTVYTGLAIGACSKERINRTRMTMRSQTMGIREEPLVAVIMGSKSDWETMRHADEILTRFDVPHECRIISAHRTPGLVAEFAAAAESRGVEVIIAGAGGAAHLPGMVAAQTLIPVLGVPVESH